MIVIAISKWREAFNSQNSYGSKRRIYTCHDLIGKNSKSEETCILIYTQRSIANPTYQTQQPSLARQRPDFCSFEFASLYCDSAVCAAIAVESCYKALRCFAPPPNNFIFHKKYYKKWATANISRYLIGLSPC